MPTRRNMLLTGAVLATARPSVWGFAPASAAVRYKSWLDQFKRDIAQFGARGSGKNGISEDDVGRMCKASIVPASRAALMVSEWLSPRNDGNGGNLGGRRYMDLSSIAMLLLAESVPAGYGGLFPEPSGSRFPSKRFDVWYVHVSGPSSLQKYFNDTTQFPVYKLPPDGTLKRRAYPFLLFEDLPASLRLAGIGAEWMGAADYLNRKQYF